MQRTFFYTTSILYFSAPFAQRLKLKALIKNMGADARHRWSGHKLIAALLQVCCVLHCPKKTKNERRYYPLRV